MPESPDLIAVEDVSHRYRGSHAPALDAVTLGIPEGSCLGLLGHNGAGKSTLISLLTGVLPLQSGEFRFRGERIEPQVRMRDVCGYVPQDFAFYPRLRVRENLAFFASAYALGKREADESITRAAELCRLEDFMERRADRLSGGLKRRLNLAIGFLNTPELLMLDEPTVGIDATSRAIIVAAIAGMRERGATIVYTSHYLEEVEALCDHLAILDAGELVLSGAVSTLLANEAQSSTQLQLDRPAEGAAAERFTNAGATLVGPNLYEFGTVGLDALVALARAVEADGYTVIRLEHGKPRLESLYLRALSKEGVV